jgi:hypothetical protein
MAMILGYSTTSLRAPELNSTIYLIVMISMVILLASLAVGLVSARTMVNRQAYPYDPNTTPYCSYWYDNDGTTACQDIPAKWVISMADFLRWVKTYKSPKLPMCIYQLLTVARRILPSHPTAATLPPAGATASKPRGSRLALRRHPAYHPPLPVRL